MGRFIDLTGQKFGKLTVIERAENRIQRCGKTETRWLCKCDCGNFNTVTAKNLRQNDTTSCGRCPRNTYDLSGDYGVGYTSSGIKFLFDLEDYGKIKEYNWGADKDGYITSSVKIGDKSQNIKMHRIVMNPSKNEQIDHINHMVWDNRKSNLRVCSSMQNNWNKNKTKANSTGYRGVYWSKERQKYVAEIMCDGKRYRLGRFKTAEEASKAYEQKAKELFGEFYCHD